MGHCTALHCTALHCTALHCTALHCIALHCTALHCTALHCTALHCTAVSGRLVARVLHHVCPAPPHHTKPARRAPGLEPPDVEVLHSLARTQHLPLPLAAVAEDNIALPAAI